MSHVFDVSVVTALYQKAVPLFRPPYYLEYTITPRPQCDVVLFALRKDDCYVAHASVIYTIEGLAVCDHVDSAIGHRVGSFLFLLHYRVAMECGVRLFTLDNMTDDPPRAARGIYSMLIWEEGREGDEIPLAYLDHMEGRWPGNGAMKGPEILTPSGSTIYAGHNGPEMVGVPCLKSSVACHTGLVAQAWNAALRCLRDRVLMMQSPKNGENPWSSSVREIMRPLFLPYHPMILRSFLLSW
jgi:hypothetical protein